MPVLPRAVLSAGALAALLILLLAGCAGVDRAEQLRDAAALGDDDTAYAILEHNPELATAAAATDGCGHAPLAFAAARGNAALVDTLLQHGADPRQADMLGFTPLHWAARAGSLAVVERMLAAHADPVAASQDGWTTLHFAVVATGSPASVDDRVAILKRLCAGRDAQVECNRAAGRWRVTPLHVAAVQGTPALVAALLAAGADPAVKDADGKTPLDDARENHRDDTAAVLTAPRDHP